MKHVISINDFGKEGIFNEILPACQDRIEFAKKREIKSHPEKKAIFAFFEPSTRTRGSYVEASRLLGWERDVIVGEEATSLSKKESMANTGRTFAIQGADVLVMRTKIEGAQRFIAEILEKEGYETAVQNGGDGTNQHPTQTFLDLLTILRFKNRLDELKVGFMGDLKYGRTVHSLLCALAYRNDISIALVSPPETALPNQYKYPFSGKIQEGESLELLTDCDIVYIARFQEERFKLEPLTLQRIIEKFQINRKVIKTLKDKVIIMHPQPYVTEIAPEVRRDKKIVVDEQSWCGIPVRIFLLDEGYKNRKRATLPQSDQNSQFHIVKKMPLNKYFKQREKRKTVNKYFLPVANGTVIDHIPQGLALKIREFLSANNILVKGVKHIIEDVPSGKYTLKDVLILEDIFIPDQLMSTISSFAPVVTFDIVRQKNFRKIKIKAPTIIYGIGKCPNEFCITNHDPEASSKFTHSNNGLKCYYCEKEFNREEVI